MEEVSFSLSPPLSLLSTSRHGSEVALVENFTGSDFPSLTGEKRHSWSAKRAKRKQAGSNPHCEEENRESSAAWQAARKQPVASTGWCGVKIEKKIFWAASDRQAGMAGRQHDGGRQAAAASRLSLSPASLCGWQHGWWWQRQCQPAGW